jgi:hypothetical protein
MPTPIICLDEGLRQFIAAFRTSFSRPQQRYFVIVLLGLMLCQESRTLSGLQRQVAEPCSVSGLSRFLSTAPWSAEQVAQTWLARFREQLASLVEAERQRLRGLRPKRRGRPKPPVVTGYLIGDDSTQAKPKAQAMAGLGRHHSTTAGQRVVGHSLLQGVYVLLGRCCPLAPQVYRQRATCEAEGVAFHSKIDLMVDLIASFEPVSGTQTHVLLDTWYTAKRIWQAVRARDWLITSGLKSNRSLAVEDATQPAGWRWDTLASYAARLSADDYSLLQWFDAEGEHQLYVHAVSTRVRKLYRCQVVVLRHSLDAPLAEARFWASSDLTADPATLVSHILARWTIEVLFGDTKAELGLDHYQLMSATAIVRFWTLVMAAYAFLDEERARLAALGPPPVTLGDTRRHVQRLHRRHLVDWIVAQFQAGVPTDVLYQRLAA